MIKINDEFIKNCCSPTVYKRGEECFRRGRAQLKSRPDDVITATVDDDVLYNVQIQLCDTGIDFMFCSCAYFKTMGTPCKHIVAALMKKLADCAAEPSEDENDALCSGLWRSYSANENTYTRVPIRFDVTVNISTPFDYNYLIAIYINNKELSNPIEFFSARSRGAEFEISRRQRSITSRSFSAYENAVLDILTEVYENNIAANEIISISSHISFGASAARRIFELLPYTDYSITCRKSYLGKIRITDGDPDIIIDITASGDEISLYAVSAGTSLTPDGSVFMYEDTIYLTSSEWRSRYMPIYRALASDNRTQLTFRGDNALGFATYALPRICELPGVTADNISDSVITAKPVFTAYLDCRAGMVTCALKAAYGGISLRLPDGDAGGIHKIVVRDREKEAALLSCFDGFTLRDGLYCLDDDEKIFDFLSSAIKELSSMATVLTTDSFTRSGIRTGINISARVDYSQKIDLLEAHIDSELTVEEMREILSACRERKRFYRLRDGSFIDIENNRSVIEPLRRFGITENTAGPDISIPKYRLLYLSAISDGSVELSDAARGLCEQLCSAHAVIPNGLDNILRDYQKDGLNWMKQLTMLGLGGILADDMGLGKTLQTLAFIHGEKPSKPALIITPSSLTYNWKAELARFIPGASALIIDGTRTERAQLLKNVNKYEFIITSYPLLRRDIAHYSQLMFSFCIIDEAQNIKNPKTMNAHCVKQIRADHHFALTGTPIENSLSELWSIFDFVMRGYLDKLTDFREWYELPIMHGSIAAADELKAKIHPFVLRRMKTQVLGELPEKIENTILAEMTQEQTKVYSTYRALARDRAEQLLADSAPDSRMQILTLLLRLRQICCHPLLFDEAYKKDSGKLRLLLSLTETALASGHRLLIFSQFTSMLDIIKKELDKADITYMYLDGKTSARVRSELCDRFNSGEGDVFLISLRAGGTGLNLTGADTVIHYDPWWNPAVTDQGSDRAYRIGQTRAVQIIRLAARGTIEEKILELQEQKRALAENITSANDASLSNMTPEEIMSLFD